MANLTVAAHTLGCKVNQCDTDGLITELKNMGLTVKDFSEVADIYIINSCTVTHTSDKKSRQMLRRAKKLNPSAFVALCGCMVKNATNINNADFIFETRNPAEFYEKVKKLLPKNIEQTESISTKTRTFIKIQDGCNRYCSYCIVPYVRGDNIISRPMAEILATGAKLIKAGALEIVLTGIQVASYGDDLEKDNLSLLIKEMSALKGLKRLRLSSIDPWAVDDDFLNVVSNSPTLCDHFHLSLQSGSDTVLKLMNRRYTVNDYENAANRLREIKPNCALTTDIIVGFPNETDNNFAETMAFAEKMAFAQVHVFEYSPRDKTPAATFENQVQHKIKSERSFIMRELTSKLRQDFLLKQIGKTVPVLFEKKFKGHTTNYCPVELLDSNINLTNTIQMVKITGFTDNVLQGYIKGD